MNILNVLQAVYLIVSFVTVSFWLLGRKYLRMYYEKEEGREGNYKKGKIYLRVFGVLLIIFIIFSGIIIYLKK